MVTRRRALGATALLSLAACGDSLPDPWLVDAPRIAAMRAEPRGALPGSSVEVTVLHVAPSSSPAPAFLWWYCVSSEGQDARSCTPDVAIRTSDSGLASNVTIPADATPGQRVTVFAASCTTVAPAVASSLDAMRCADDVAPSIAFKHVDVLAPGTLAARNPRLSSLTLDGEPVAERTPSCAAGRACTGTLAATVSDTDAARTLTDFLVTGGDVDPFRAPGLSPHTVWTLPRDAVARVWAITRDGGGGVTWVDAALQPVGAR